MPKGVVRTFGFASRNERGVECQICHLDCHLTYTIGGEISVHYECMLQAAREIREVRAFVGGVCDPLELAMAWNSLAKKTEELDERM